LETETLLVYSVCPFLVEVDDRAAVAEYITRANATLAVAALEIDLDDGQVRCRAAISVPEDDLTDELIRRTTEASALTMDRYLPGIVRILGAEIAPLAAFASVDSD
jgi:hypothetical protein